jgi:hypothetical protein
MLLNPSIAISYAFLAMLGQGIPLPQVDPTPFPSPSPSSNASSSGVSNAGTDTGAGSGTNTVSDGQASAETPSTTPTPSSAAVSLTPSGVLSTTPTATTSTSGGALAPGQSAPVDQRYKCSTADPPTMMLCDSWDISERICESWKDVGCAEGTLCISLVSSTARRSKRVQTLNG